MNTTSKTIFLVVIVNLFSLSSSAQLCSNAFYNGYWGEWKKQYDEYTGSYYKLYGNNSGFIIYHRNSHPSEYVFKFKIDNYTPPSKETIKYHRKNNIWYEYSGSVEYFINNDYPTIKKALSSYNCFPQVENKVENIKKTARATIKIAPYKKHPTLYNIWFEDVGFALDLGSIYFKQ